MEPSPEVLRAIRAIALDIDGVITDGGLIPLADGDLLRKFDAKDSFAIRVAGKKGYKVAIISGGDTRALRLRCLNLGIPEENLFLGSRGKLAVFRDFCAREGLEPREVMYQGDDIPDTQVLRACGLGVAPADAVPEARAAADFVSPFPGGRGCVRDSIERVLKAQGKWVFDEDKYDQIF